jgi:AmmeMemoRadiSam system protein A
MSPQPENPAVSCRPGSSEANEYSPEERAILLRWAHESIRCAVEQGELSLEPPIGHLAEPRGVFTTLYLHGALRGCVGYPLPIAPLYRAVAESARSAAFEDTRFWPVSRDEGPQLSISLSVLSPLQPIEAEQVEVGRHGLLISHAGHRGLLLPQVPVEHGWDRLSFLEQTCHKAGLALDAWRRGAKLESFTAEVFGDAESEP